MTRSTDGRDAPRKRVYKAPQLKVHGDLRMLTLIAKAGTNGDGTGKPATKTGVVANG